MTKKHKIIFSLLTASLVVTPIIIASCKKTADNDDVDFNKLNEKTKVSYLNAENTLFVDAKEDKEFYVLSNPDARVDFIRAMKDTGGIFVYYSLNKNGRDSKQYQKFISNDFFKKEEKKEKVAPNFDSLASLVVIKYKNSDKIFFNNLRNEDIKDTKNFLPFINEPKTKITIIGATLENDGIHISYVLEKDKSTSKPYSYIIKKNEFSNIDPNQKMTEANWEQLANVTVFNYQNSQNIFYENVPETIDFDKITFNLPEDDIHVVLVKVKKTDKGILVEYKLQKNNQESDLFDDLIPLTKFKQNNNQPNWALQSSKLQFTYIDAKNILFKDATNSLSNFNISGLDVDFKINVKSIYKASNRFVITYELESKGIKSGGFTYSISSDVFKTPYNFDAIDLKKLSITYNDSQNIYLKDAKFDSSHYQFHYDGLLKDVSFRFVRASLVKNTPAYINVEYQIVHHNEISNIKTYQINQSSFKKDPVIDFNSLNKNIQFSFKNSNKRTFSSVTNNEINQLSSYEIKNKDSKVNIELLGAVKTSDMLTLTYTLVKDGFFSPQFNYQISSSTFLPELPDNYGTGLTISLPVGIKKNEISSKTELYFGVMVNPNQNKNHSTDITDFNFSISLTSHGFETITLKQSKFLDHVAYFDVSNLDINREYTISKITAHSIKNNNDYNVEVAPDTKFIISHLLKDAKQPTPPGNKPHLPNQNNPKEKPETEPKHNPGQFILKNFYQPDTTLNSHLSNDAFAHSLSKNDLYNSEGKMLSAFELIQKTNQYRSNFLNLQTYLKSKPDILTGSTDRRRIEKEFLSHIKNIGILGEFGETETEKAQFYTRYLEKQYLPSQTYLMNFDANTSYYSLTIDFSLINNLIKQNPFGFLPSNLSQFLTLINMEAIKDFLNLNHTPSSIKANFNDDDGTISLLIDNQVVNLDKSNVSNLKSNKDFAQYIYDRSFSLSWNYWKTRKKNDYDSSTQITLVNGGGTFWLVDRVVGTKTKNNQKVYTFLAATNAHVPNFSKIFDRSQVFKSYDNNKRKDAWYSGFSQFGLQSFTADEGQTFTNKVDQYGKSYEEVSFSDKWKKQSPFLFGKSFGDTNLSSPTNKTYDALSSVDKTVTERKAGNAWDQYLDFIYYTPRFRSGGIKADSLVSQIYLDQSKEEYSEAVRIGETPNGGMDFALVKIDIDETTIKYLFPTLFPLLNTDKEADWYPGLGNEESEYKDYISPFNTIFVAGYPQTFGFNQSFAYSKGKGGLIASKYRYFDKKDVNHLWYRYNEQENKDWNKLNNWWKEYQNPFHPKHEHGMDKWTLNQGSIIYLNADTGLKTGSSGSMAIDSRFNVIGINFSNVAEVNDPNKTTNAVTLFKGYSQYNENEFSGDVKHEVIKKLRKDQLKTLKMNP
ncbi:MAG2960 family serine endopeptidase lipoprotein [Ureaplasma canigenitalium]|uniref:MAG2960 family serine endopeptidase lipoprotein n=1 Tax=Ureaplasma canigenitalium TaxID=42092 RepID=UPI0004E16A05|nr:hypothetical protein [Ureaplasma canigenitalium]